MKKQNPTVSVIMPAYNAEKYISEAIQSVIDQTYSDWELIIINDGSTDSTVDIIRTFTDNRIHLIEQKNVGVSVARNKALDIANSKYITFLDADDILPHNSLESRIKYLETHPDVDLVDGRALVKDETLQKTLRVHTPTYKGSLFPRLVRLDSQVYLTCYYMFKKEKLGTTRFRENMTHSEDILFFIELSAQQDIQYGAVEETVFIYRVGHASAMKNLDGLENGYIALIQQVDTLDKTTLMQQLYLRGKIARILFLTWLREKKPNRAFKSLAYSLGIAKKAIYDR